MALPSGIATIAVSIAYSPRAGVADEIAVTVAAGTTVIGALRASGVLDRHPTLDLDSDKVGIWGRLRPLDAILRDGDRIEIYRPLQVDPKAARRLRQARQRTLAAAATCNRRR